jgi:hypothetical protein
MRASLCRLIAAAMFGVVVWTPAFAEIRVLKSNGDLVPAGAYAISFNSKTAGYDIVLSGLYAPGLESVFDIRANAGEYINSVVIDVDGPAAGSPVIVRVQGETPGLLSGVGAIVQTGSGETILNRVQTTGDVGLVHVEVIGDLIAGRDVIGPVTATTSNNALRGITSVQAARDILGDVTADNGRILLVWAQRDIGSGAVPVTIRARHHVYHVMADQVFANINARYNGSTGGFWALVCNRFSGTLEAEKLIFNSFNNADARMAIYDLFDGSIIIGKNYNAATQYIEVPADGLQGQIIVNADNLAGGTWSAPVRVGPNGHPQQIILNTPNYTHTAAQLGGGAVGLVPFGLHNSSCIPANGATVQTQSGSLPLSVELRHYGPVTWGAAAPLAIDRRPAGSTGAYAPFPMSNFTLSRTAADRALVVSKGSGAALGFEPGYQYRIRRTPALVCAVPAAPQVIWDSDYIITVTRPPCTGDVDSNGMVNVDDLILVILFWGPALPAFPAPDIDQDGMVDVDDLIQVILHWGTCP